MQASHSPGYYTLVRAENCMCVAGQARLWGPCEHSFLHRAMCLAKSCWRICGASSLNHQLVLCLQFTVHTAICPDIAGRVCAETHSTSLSLCRELPDTQQTGEGERTRHCCGRGFTHRCLQNSHCSHRLCMTIFFSFLQKLGTSAVWSSSLKPFSTITVFCFPVRSHLACP